MILICTNPSHFSHTTQQTLRERKKSVLIRHLLSLYDDLLERKTAHRAKNHRIHTRIHTDTQHAHHRVHWMMCSQTAEASSQTPAVLAVSSQETKQKKEKRVERTEKRARVSAAVEATGTMIRLMMQWMKSSSVKKKQWNWMCMAWVLCLR